MERIRTRGRIRRLLTRGNAALAAVAVATVVATTVTPVTPATPIDASDHIDSPTLAQDHASDINDVYMFLDPNDNARVVLVATTNPFIISSEAIGQSIFDDTIRYRFEIENTGDARPDRFINVRFSKGVGRGVAQTATVKLPNRERFSGLTTVASQSDLPSPPVVTTSAGGVVLFAGEVEDPFFLDNTAANRFVLSSIANPGNPDRSVFRRARDTYAGFNTLVIVLSVPATMLRGSSDEIGINFVTQRRTMPRVNTTADLETGTGPWVNVDRQGTPLVNNGLIPAARKNEYNSAATVDDANGRFRDDIIRSLRNFGTSETFINRLLAAAVNRGDILRLNLRVPNRGPQGGNNPDGGFTNMGGRRLTDDVSDAVFTLINNGVPLGDGVPANEVPFRNTFPFVQDAAQPSPPGPNPDDRTRL